ncbi:MAG: gliding motility-associated C-terminal domain-containing protein [Flavipsychrobacter sp.]|nr:gliding motility-associated C-terminal domain-containing protein [Flavipsychrobacter sp.]
MKKLLLTLALFLPFAASSQIIGPDTVCIGTSAQFSTPHEAAFYTWSPDTVNVNQPLPNNLSSITTAVSGGFNTVCFTTISYDAGNYYSFLISYSSNNVYRLNYGNSPLNVPTMQTLGTFGLNTNQTDGIDVAKDSITGNWYAFVLGGTQFLRLNFGNSLANAPTATMMSYPAYLQWPHQVFLKKQGTEWMLFVSNRAGSISRFDFGNSLANTPTGVNIPPAGGISQPVGFFLYEQSGQWYMVVVNLIPASLTRLQLGANLQNNNPTGTNLGDFGGALALPRGSCLFSDCNQLLGYILNQNGAMTRLDFQNDITNMPVASSAGTSGVNTSNNLVSFTYNDTLYWLRTNTTQTLYRNPVFGYPPGTSSGYYNNTYNYTFTQPGLHTITLHCDQGTVQGPSSFCKQVYVTNGSGSVILNDTTVCATSYTLSPQLSGTGNTYLWNTGATTPSISVTSSGTYWVQVNGACVSGSDTAVITLYPPINVNLGSDTSLCAGQTITLQSSGTYTSPTYLWSNGNTNSSLNVSQSGTYWLQVTDGFCTARDSATVNILTPPAVQLGNDTTLCEGSTLLLQSATTYTNASYTWSTGAVTPSITVTQPGTYWLNVSLLAGCEGSDTITITQIASPVVQISNDTSVCPGQGVYITSLGTHSNPTYLWNTGSNTASVFVVQPGTYWLQVTENGCSARDSMTLSQHATPQVNIDQVDSLCIGNTAVLHAAQPPQSQYIWSTGSTADSLVVTVGIYWLQVTNTFGCTSADTVEIHPYNPPAIKLPDDTAVCRGDLLFITPKHSFGSLMWSNGLTDPQIRISESGLYIATATTICGSVSDSIMIYIEDCDIWLPNAFTPNQDGKNDVFRVVGNLSFVTEFDFKIFNRWGQCIFETGDKHEGWNGRFKDEPQELGTYAYLVKCKLGSRDVLLKGFFHLIK